MKKVIGYTVLVAVLALCLGGYIYRDRIERFYFAATLFRRKSSPELEFLEFLETPTRSSNLGSTWGLAPCEIL